MGTGNPWVNPNPRRYIVKFIGSGEANPTNIYIYISTHAICIPPGHSASERGDIGRSTARPKALRLYITIHNYKYTY